jgi:phage-related protein
MSDAVDRLYVDIEPDFSTFNRNVASGVSAAARDLSRKIGNAVEDVEDRFADLGDSINDEMTAAVEGLSRTMDMTAEGMTVTWRNAAGEIVDRFGRALEQAEDDVDDLGDKVDRVGRKRLAIDVDVDREGTFSRFLSSITGVRLPVAGFAALGTAAAAAAGAVIQLGAALAPAVGIVAALPAAVGVGAAAIGTLQVATAGFSDAMAAAFEDTEAFDAAIEQLSPNAQAAAEAFRAIVPELQALQDSAQDAFFADLDEAITNVAATLTGPLSSGMTTAAGYAGGLVTALLNVAGSESGVNFVTSSFETLNGILSQLAAPVAALFTSLLDLGTAINTAFGGDAAVSGLATLTQRFADFIANATASGDAVAWVQDALTVFQQLSDIVSPIVGIIDSIGSAASSTGGNILGVFGQALQVFDDFLASAQGQDILVTIFEALNQVGASFGTVLANIAPALPPIISGISGILSAVSPLLGPLSELVGSVLGALAPILGVVATAIQPLIGPLTNVLNLLGPILIDAISSVMPLIEMIAGLFAGALGIAIGLVGTALEALTPVFTAVFDALQPVIEALQPLFQLLGVVADIVGAVLQPVLQALGAILLWVVENVIVPYVIPIVELLIDLLVSGLGATINWLVEQFQGAGEGIAVIFNFIKEAGQSQVDAMKAAWQVLSNAFQAAWSVINARVFTPLKNGINTVKSVVSTALSNTRASWDTFVSFVKGIPGRISGALSGMFAPLASGFKSAINTVIAGWNNLSFSIPSVDIPGIGSVGGGTINTPNIPYLQTGGFTQAEGLAMLHPDEMVLPLTNSNGINALANALRSAGLGGAGEQPIQVIVQIGNETITSMVDTRVNQNNRTLTRRARAATGRNT